MAVSTVISAPFIRKALAMAKSRFCGAPVSGGKYWVRKMILMPRCAIAVDR